MIDLSDFEDFNEYVEGEEVTRVCQLGKDQVKIDFYNKNSMIIFIDKDGTLSMEII
jgi:hypothetical protein